MTRVLLATLAVVAALLAAPGVGAEERILRFQSDIQVNHDGSMEVVETIAVRAEGAAIKRGIYRDFPTRYRTASGHRMNVGFEVLGVKRDGAPESWFTKTLSNGVRLYIGREEQLLQHGKHVFEITYRTDRQLGFFEQHDELYWNVTGNGWAFPIDHVVAFVYLPRTVPDARIGFEGYSGVQGAKGQDLRSGLDEEGVVWFETTRALAPSEGLTIVTTWPKGYVREPTARMKTRWFLDDNAEILIGVIGLGLLLAYYLAVWFKVGRDPEAGVIFPRYEPPRGYSPASMRFVRRMGYDHKAFTAALVNLAVNGRVDIEERQDGDYVVTRRDSSAPTAPGEKALLDALLGGGVNLIIRRSNHARISKAIAAHKTRLAADYERIYFNSNAGYTVAGIGMSLAVLMAALLLSPALEELFPALFLLVWLTVWTFGVMMLLSTVVRAWRRPGFGSRAGALILGAFSVPFVAGWFAGAGFLWAQAGAGLVVLVLLLVGTNALFYQIMKAPTLQGRELLDQIEGFLEYLGTAEKDELALKNPPRKTPELFERLLPYAIALDVEDVWGERFASTLAEAEARGGYSGPAWYRSPGRFSASGFTSALGSGLASSISASSTAPGSSSGSGGGGSSGGGGGGGGGGGW